MPNSHHCTDRKNLDFYTEDERVIIHYDLTGEGPFKVSLLYTLNGYGWQSVPPLACSGAIGDAISSGNGLNIIWIPLLHLESLEGSLSLKLQVHYKEKENDNLVEMVLCERRYFSRWEVRQVIMMKNLFILCK